LEVGKIRGTAGQATESVEGVDVGWGDPRWQLTSHAGDGQDVKTFLLQLGCQPDVDEGGLAGSRGREEDDHPLGDDQGKKVSGLVVAAEE
jgi:hypothetical protein